MKKICRGHRLADLIPLQPVTAELLQKFDLAIGFDALCHAAHTEVVAQVDEVPDDRLLARTMLCLADQAAVDFCHADLRQIEHFQTRRFGA